MRSLCEIERIDIPTKTLLLLTYLLAPCVRHMHHELNLFEYLNDHKRSKCLFDSNYVNIIYNHMPVEDRSIYQAKVRDELYPESLEDLLTNAQNHKVQTVQISCSVVADNGGYLVTRRTKKRNTYIIKHNSYYVVLEAVKYGGDFYSHIIVCSNEAVYGNIHGAEIQALDNLNLDYGQ